MRFLYLSLCQDSTS